MGSGAARELSTSKELPELDPDLAKKLTAAVKRMDEIDTEFAEARHNERLSQLVKIWGAACAEIDEHFLTLSNLLNETHQLSLEPGTVGGGRNITPWMEEAGGRFDRLVIKLEGEHALALNGETLLAKCGLPDLGYPWLERVVVKWVIVNIKAKL